MSSRGKDKYDHKSFNGTTESRLAESRSDTFKKKCPLRVQNDWSEHISSKGLIYYYNCRTEVSQWQKPDEWTLSSMPHEDVKRLLTAKNRESNNNKRFYPNQSITDLNTSPKRIKYSNNNNNNNSNQTASIDKTSNYKLYPPKVPKIDQVKNSKSINTISNNLSGITANNNNNKIKANEANFNNDDMDISPGSSPLSRGSHSPTESDKKHTSFEQPLIYNRTAMIVNNNKTQKVYNKSWSVEQKLENSSPAVNQDSTVVNVNVSVNNPIKTIIPNQIITKPINKYSENQSNSNSNSHSLTQFQISLAASLRSTLNVLHSRSQFFSKDENSHSKPDNCLSVFHISDLLIRIEAVNNNGETANSYRSHRLQAQLSQNNNSFPYSNNNNSNNNNSNNNDHLKSNIKPSANITQIKELVKSLQDFIQENYPNSLSIITPVSPNYSKSSNRMSHYLQVLTNLIETCLMQLCPQSFNSPSSTSSPGSLKDNNSSVSTPGTSQSYAETTNKIDIDSPHKKESMEIEKPKSILQDIEMMKYISSDVTNSYRNQLADFYVQEAQVEYYKFVRLHSVLYAELACESKKLKALVRISEINTDLLKQKKEDLEKLVQMLESRRLPNHLKCDYVPNS